MSALDLSLYLVTDTALCGERGVPATVAEAVAGGVTAVQLRDHDLDDDAFVALGRELRTVLEGTGVPLLVNDRVHLVQAIGADGAHVGQGDTAVPRARELLGADRLLGLSAGTPAELEAAREHGKDALDYLGVGPVWATTTKPGHAEPIGLDGVREVATASPWPCVAIGGVGAESAGELRGTRAAGIAVVSAICGQPDPRAAAAGLREVWGDGS